MSKRPKGRKAPAGAPRTRSSHGRQRQRLIDACISALHLYGPSRTTVAKVVAIAKMSPGIVRFYFDSKAAMLVASLRFLADEFEERLLAPVAMLKSTPVAALELMVDLYLDPDIASPRKVSVWYAFWGEASSRQEYYDICGQQDVSFAALVRELVESLIALTRQAHLDPDGISLGLIGVLEILWQDFAFQTERDIDRAAAKKRCMAYLRSIFPGQFPAAVNTGAEHTGAVQAGAVDARAVHAGALHAAAADADAVYAAVPFGDAVAHTSRFGAGAYASASLHALERERLFRTAWVVVGHDSQLARAGEFLTIDTGADRALVVRDTAGHVHALRNSCPEAPHALVSARSGRFALAIECKLHGQRFSLDGRRAPGWGRTDLVALDLASVGGLLFARSAPRGGRATGPTAADPAGPESWFDTRPPAGLALLGGALEVPVAADWKVVVEQWLQPPALHPAPHAEPSCAANFVVWQAPALNDSGWSARHYAHLMACTPQQSWRRQFIAPHQLLETRPDGLSVVQAIPAAPGLCSVRRLDYTLLAPDNGARAARDLARRLGPYARRSSCEVAESVQRGVTEFGYDAAAGGASAPLVAWFRHRLIARIPALALPAPD